MGCLLLSIIACYVGAHAKVLYKAMLEITVCTMEEICPIQQQQKEQCPLSKGSDRLSWDTAILGKSY